MREAVVDHFWWIFQVFLLHFPSLGVEMTEDKMNLSIKQNN
jgi:hypothetical protein